MTERSLIKKWLARVSEPRGMPPLRYAALICVTNHALAAAIRATAGAQVFVVTCVAELEACWTSFDVATSIVIAGDLDELGAVELSLIFMARWPRAPLLWVSRNGTPELPPASSRSDAPLPQLSHAEIRGGLSTPATMAEAIHAHRVKCEALREREREDALAFGMEFGIASHEKAQRHVTLAHHRIPKEIACRLCEQSLEELRDHGRNTLYKKTGTRNYEELLNTLGWWIQQHRTR